VAAEEAPEGAKITRVTQDDMAALWEANAPAWIELSRLGADVYRDLVNTPAFLAMLPNVEGLVGVDLGCGEGHNTRLVRDRGARMIGIDISPTFLRAAYEEERAAAQPVAYLLSSGHGLPLRDRSVDFAVGFMSLMDMSDPPQVMLEAGRVLRPGGFLQFSICHPATSVPIRSWVHDGTTGERSSLVVGGYFEDGPLEDSWFFSAAPEDLRDRHDPFRIRHTQMTLSGWLNAVISSGLVVEEVDEPHADEPTATAHPEVADTRIVPYFLIVRARRPGTR
jgi:SAM-dependent methyltransferase